MADEKMQSENKKSLYLLFFDNFKRFYSFLLNTIGAAFTAPTSYRFFCFL